MKFTSLKTIERVLREEIQAERTSYNHACDRVKKLYQAQEEGFAVDDLEHWKESKSKRYRILTDLENALDDFLTHEWK